MKELRQFHEPSFKAIFSRDIDFSCYVRQLVLTAGFYLAGVLTASSEASGDCSVGVSEHLEQSFYHG